jgi:thiamine pyrophosphokinase
MGKHMEHHITKIENIMKCKYNINKKIHKLKNEQRIDTQQNTNTFYKQTNNLSNVTFTDEETQLLSKSLKYNLQHK